MTVAHSAPQGPILQHVAIIMDGNNRWAKARGKSGLAGHKAGGKTVEVVTDAAIEYGVKFLTLFAFSSENWKRPQAEVRGLMELFATTLKNDLPNLIERRVRLKVVGRRDRLSARLVKLIENAEAQTAQGDQITVTLAVDYGGRWDLMQAAQALSPAECSDEESLASNLALAYAGDVDLLIRTGGEYRISNFLLWQSAYAELVFSEDLWPDFDQTSFELCIAEYQRRERRFGMTSEQVQAKATQ